MKANLFYYLFVFIFLSACSSSSEIKVLNDPNTSATTYSQGVFVVNEGNFSWGQGTISFIDTKNKKVYQRIFERENEEILGNVAQSMTVFENKIYLVVNNSQKVEVLNPETFKRIATIEGLNSPRYFLGINSQKAYITDLYQNGIWIIDLKNNVISGKIDVEGWTEQLIKVGDDVFVCNYSQGILHLIDSQTDQIKQNILLSVAPNSIQVDKNKNIWVLCGGDNQNVAQLIEINSQSLEIKAKFDFGVSDIPSELIINTQGDVLYFINGGIGKLEITAANRGISPFIAKGNHLFYGLGISPKDNKIYASDALDYLQDGFVYRFEAETGAKIDSFQVGIIPSAFYFNQ